MRLIRIRPLPRVKSELDERRTRLDSAARVAFGGRVRLPSRRAVENGRRRIKETIPTQSTRTNKTEL